MIKRCSAFSLRAEPGKKGSNGSNSVLAEAVFFATIFLIRCRQKIEDARLGYPPFQMTM
jgi:hypothetical protein